MGKIHFPMEYPRDVLLRMQVPFPALIVSFVGCNNGVPRGVLVIDTSTMVQDLTENVS